MKLLPILFLTLLLLVGCSDAIKKYKLSDDELDRKIFESYLNQRNISYQIAHQNFYTVPASKYDEIVIIGRSVLKKASDKTSLDIGKSCSAKKLLEWLDNTKIIFLENKEIDNLSITLTREDFELNHVMNHYAQFHSECSNSGLEAKYNDIWRRVP